VQKSDRKRPTGIGRWIEAKPTCRQDSRTRAGGAGSRAAQALGRSSHFPGLTRSSSHQLATANDNGPVDPSSRLHCCLADLVQRGDVLCPGRGEPESAGCTRGCFPGWTGPTRLSVRTGRAAGRRDARVGLPPGLGLREQPPQLDLRVTLGLARLPEPDLPSGQRVLPALHLCAPRPARQLLNVTRRVVLHSGTMQRCTDIGPRPSPCQA
jgi:hypothetical protein